MPIIPEKLLENYIKEHDKLKQEMDTGENYYLQQNEAINNRKKLMGVKRGDTYSQVEDPFASNQQLASGFLKQQIKQKVGYLINEDITLSDDNEDFSKQFPNWTKNLKQLATKVSYHIYGGWLFFINNENEVEYKFIDGKELYPIFFNGTETPDLVMRHYTTYDGDEKAVIYSNKREFHYKLTETKWEFVEEKPLAVLKKVLGDDVLEETAAELPMPPIAMLFNNDEWKTDLAPIKNHVDIYDYIDSDFANNILDFQEIYYTLKNYNGQDLNEFLNQMKKLKVTPIREDGDVQSHTQEVPVNAKKTYLEMKRRDIFEWGMAVDLQRLGEGKKVTTEIQSMFEGLNIKANDFEQELQDFWRQVIIIVNAFNEILNINIQYDHELIFEKSMLSNQKEKSEIQKAQVETVTMLAGLIDNETLAELVTSLDFVKENADVTAQDILDKLEQEKQAIQITEEE